MKDEEIRKIEVEVKKGTISVSVDASGLDAIAMTAVLVRAISKETDVPEKEILEAINYTLKSVEEEQNEKREVSKCPFCGR